MILKMANWRVKRLKRAILRWICLFRYEVLSDQQQVLREGGRSFSLDVQVVAEEINRLKAGAKVLTLRRKEVVDFGKTWAPT